MFGATPFSCYCNKRGRSCRPDGLLSVLLLASNFGAGRRRFGGLGVSLSFISFSFSSLLFIVLEYTFRASSARAFGCRLPAISFLSVNFLGRNDWDCSVFLRNESLFEIQEVLVY